MGDRTHSIVIGALLQDIVASCDMLITEDESTKVWVREILECVHKISMDDGFCDVAPLNDACSESSRLPDRIPSK